MANNNSLAQAKKAKNDEFYTQWADIEKEMNAYLEYDPSVFKDKTILLPADDPFESNFFKFFATHFNDYGLRKLIATSYDPSPIMNTQLALSLFPDEEDGTEVSEHKISRAYRIVLTDVSDFDKNGRVNIADVETKLRQEKARINKGKHSDILQFLVGDDDPNGETRFPAGDFRSREVTLLRDEADIVITNPPFSLFREFLAWIIEEDNPLSSRQFVVLGNMNAITYKEVFPYIQRNEIWLGYKSLNEDMYFTVTDDYKKWLVENKKAGSAYKIINGEVMGRLASACWFTNINHGRRHQPLSLMTMEDNIKYSKRTKVKGHAYVHYDNYDAIEVPYNDSIPGDFDGVMGVPITFLGKYNPDQFEILGSTQRGTHDLVPDTKKYDDYWEVRQNGTKTGSSGGKTNENANIAQNDGKKNYFINSEGHVIQSAYQRIFIRRKQQWSRS